jgi:hypothetical protein
MAARADASTARATAESPVAADRAHTAHAALAAVAARNGPAPASWRADLAHRELLQAEVQSLKGALESAHEMLRQERAARELIVQRAVSAARAWAVRAKAIAAGEDPERPEFYAGQRTDEGEDMLERQAADEAASDEEARLTLASDADAAAASLFEFSVFAQAGALAQARGVSSSGAPDGACGEAQAAGGCVGEEAVRQKPDAAAYAYNGHARRGGSLAGEGTAAEGGEAGASDGWEACARALQLSVESLEVELASRPSASEYVALLDRAERAEAALAEAAEAEARAGGSAEQGEWQPAEREQASSTRLDWDGEWEPHQTRKDAMCSDPPPDALVLDLCGALGVSSPTQLRPAIDALLARTASAPSLERFVAQVLRILASASEDDDLTRSPALALAELSRWAADRPELTRLRACVADALCGKLGQDRASLSGGRHAENGWSGEHDTAGLGGQAGGFDPWRAGAAPWRHDGIPWGGIARGGIIHGGIPRGGTLEAKAARVQASLVQWLSSGL